MEKKNCHLIEVDLETQGWIEQYAERKGLSIQETLGRLFIAGRFALERQEIESSNLQKDDLELALRVKVGAQASMECLSMLRKVYLSNLADQKRLALEVKTLIETTISQIIHEKIGGYS